MTEQEKIAYFISMCKSCTLAGFLKACPRCQFNIGLAIPVELPTPKPIPAPIILASSLTVAG